MIKGTVLYELFKLTGYWYKTLSTNPQNQKVKRHQCGPHRKQYLIHFAPKEKSEKKPIILYYHGGGWIFGKPEIFAKKATIFTEQGYDFIIPSYRKVPFYNADHIREDLDLTLAFLETYLKQDQFKNRKIILGGTSAGGSLVARIYFQKEQLYRYGFKDEDFIGMFLTAAPLDLSKMKKNVVMSSYAGKTNSERFTNASPIMSLSRKDPIEILSFHGTRDGLVQLDASQSFLDKYEGLHPGLVENIKLKDYGHIDSASWAHSNNAIRKKLLEWLAKF